MITLGIPAYNETRHGLFKWVQECVAPAGGHPLVSEIVVVDDGSNDSDQLAAALEGAPKVRIHRVEQNGGVFASKVECVYQAQSEWVQLCDSDNLMGAAYWDRLDAIRPWDEKTWYSASFGYPALDYRVLAGEYRLGNFADILKHRVWGCAVNTGNQLVHRARFLEIFEKYRGVQCQLLQPNYFDVADRSTLHWRRVYDALDSFFLNKQWWLAGGCLRFVEGLTYLHRMHPESNYITSPVEKDQLPEFYKQELLDAAK